MIDTSPLDEALDVLRTLLPWLRACEPAAERALAQTIAALETWGKDLEEHECEPPDEPDHYYSLGEPVR